MKRGWVNAFLLVFLTITIALTAASCGSTSTSMPSVGEEFALVTDPAEQGRPAISGNIVVWQDERNGNYDIYGYNLCRGKEFSICTEPDEHGNLDPAISGDVVVWTDGRYYLRDWEIYGYDLATGTEFPICTNISWQYDPAI